MSDLKLPTLLLAAGLLLGGCAASGGAVPDGRAPAVALKTQLDPAAQSRFLEDYARLLLASGRETEAESLLEALHRARPEDQIPLRLLARAYEAEGRPSLALLAWGELLRRSTASADAAEYARLALLNGQYAEAEAVYRGWLDQAAAGTALQVAAHNNMGYSRLLQGQTEAARAHFEQALRLDPLDRRARGNLALSHELDGQHGLAAAQWQILGRSSRTGTP
jgi:Flp pilus assembly protein TadD